LVDTFINTSSNTRTDEYGGSIENRARFPLELLDALVEAIGANKVALRFSPWSGFQDMEDDTPVETWSYLTQQIQSNHSDLAYLHFVESREGGHSDEELLEHESLDPFRNIWQGPFITSGGSPNNLISFGRLFIANPDLVDRIRNDWPLNKYHRPTFYTQGLDGYIDYPFYTPTTSNDGDKDDDIVPVVKVTDDLAVAESAATDDATADSAVTESNPETVQQPDTKADKRKSKKSSTAKCIIQ
jgi:2,4-dienoyl-CoA reductase-like NADH-dependent reductase (Old Yellow Enzyme family)